MLLTKLKQTEKDLDTLLATFQARPAEQIKMSTWVCGSSACLFGTAALIPEFNARGLALQLGPNEHRMDIKYGTKTGFYAATEFFGLSYSVAAKLGGPDEYPLIGFIDCINGMDVSSSDDEDSAIRFTTHAAVNKQYAAERIKADVVQRLKIVLAMYREFILQLETVLS